MSSATTKISTRSKYVPPADPSLRGVMVRVIELVDSYMVWVGVVEGLAEDMDRAVMNGSLCKDWACAMPPKRTGEAAPATSLFRSGGSDVALSMAQRLARRTGKQVFVSIDGGSGRESGREVVAAERTIVEML